MNILQQFLNHLFIEVSNDDDLGKLNKTVDEVVKKLSKDKGKIPSYTLVAFDPETSFDDPVVIEVRQLITKHWKTFAPNSKDTPKTFIRAVILSALEKLTTRDVQLASLVWLSIRNIVRYLTLGREKELLTKFLREISSRIEREALDHWSSRPEPNGGSIEFLVTHFDPIIVDKEALKKKLAEASGPTNSEGTATSSSPNPHWPNAGSGWSHEFAPRAANAISSTVDKALGQHQSKMWLAVGEAMASAAVRLDEKQNALIEKNRLFNIRTQLLWWKEARYSQFLDEGYQNVQSPILEIALAKDYSGLVPTVFPRSVDFFLAEAHKSLSDEAGSMKLSALLSNLQGHPEPLANLFHNYNAESTRISLLGFIAGMVLGQYTLKQFETSVGIDPKTEISLKEFLLWVFHDFQSQKILTGNDDAG